jgi:hypothetical protein
LRDREQFARGFGRCIEASFAESGLLPDAFMRGSPMLWQAGMKWDNLNAEWNDWVVKYDEAIQKGILTSLGFDDPGWAELAAALGIGFAVAIAILALWLAFELRPRSTDPAAAAYRRYLGRLKRCGNEHAPSVDRKSGTRSDCKRLLVSIA